MTELQYLETIGQIQGKLETLEKANKRLRSTLEALVGSSDKDELIGMKMAIQALVSNEHPTKKSILDAIDLLIILIEKDEQ